MVLITDKNKEKDSKYKCKMQNTYVYILLAQYKTSIKKYEKVTHNWFADRVAQQGLAFVFLFLPSTLISRYGGN